MERSEVNYIIQMNTAFNKLAEEDGLTSAHLSLYWTLFQFWNAGKFTNPFSICRAEIMRLARIGSKTTYYKTLKDLHRLGYIDYEASNSPLRGSWIKMAHFSSVPHSGQLKGQHEGQVLSHIRDNSKDNYVPLSGQLEGPSINSINNKHSKQVNKKVSKKVFTPPSIDELKDFFLESESTSKEAENFFNYFESNGWLVGGKAKMKNWKAAARNWISRSSNFKKPEKKNYLNVNQDKDYSIPL